MLRITAPAGRYSPANHDEKSKDKSEFLGDEKNIVGENTFTLQQCRRSRRKITMMIDQDQFREHARRLDFELVGIAPVEDRDGAWFGPHADRFESWIKDGKHAQMQYLASGPANA